MQTAKGLQLLLLLCLSQMFVYAQKSPIKFGKVDPADLQMQDCAFEPGAAAMVLCDYGEGEFFIQMRDGFAFRLNRHKRIKILTKSGLDRANVSLRFYAGKYGNFEKIRNVKAMCHYLENGAVKTVELAKNDVFVTETGHEFKELKFAIPGAREGCVIEYSYELTSLDISNLRDWYFQGELPVLLSAYRLTVPDFFVFQQVIRGGRRLDANFVKATNQMFSGEMPQPNGLTERINFSSSAQQFNMSMAEVPSLRDEPFVAAQLDFAAHLECQLIRMQFPDGRTKEVMPSYQKFSSDLDKHDRFGENARPGNFEKQLVQNLAGNIADPKEKAAAILRHLQEKIKWDGFYGIYADQPPAKTFEKGSGNAASINLMLVACLRAAGLSADPVILGTRTHYSPHPVYPNEGKFDYVVAVLELEDKLVLADATAGGIPLGYVGKKCLHGQGWRVSAQSPGWIPLQTYANGARSVLMQISGNDNGWEGKVTLKATGYAAAETLGDLQQTDLSAYQQKALKPWADWNPEAPQFKQLDDDGLATLLEASIKRDLDGEDVLYFNPVIAGSILENPLTAETRTNLLDFPYTTNYNYVLNLEMPPGYTPAEMPKETVVTFGNKRDMVFQYRCSLNNNVVTVISKLQMNRYLFTPEEYADLRQFYNAIVQKNQEILVLKKS